MPDILYNEDGPVATITLNRPAALNAFNQAARLQFIEAMRTAENAQAVRAVVLCGAGRGFSSGTDLNEGVPLDGVHTILEKEFNPGILAIERLPKPVIAAVHGFAAGIGLSYALACDLIVIGEKSFMQVPFAKIGLVPDGGLCWQLARRLGHRLAFELAMAGERLPAALCKELGLANRVVADDAVLEAAGTWARQLSDQPPLAMAGTKLALRAAGGSTLEEVMQLEARYQQKCVTSADFKEGVAAFFEKRAPRFTGT